MSRWSVATALFLTLVLALSWSLTERQALADQDIVPFEIPQTIVCDDATYTLSDAFRTSTNEHVNAAGDTMITVVQKPNGMVAEDGDGNTFRVVGVIHGQIKLSATGRGHANIGARLRIVEQGGGTVGTVGARIRLSTDGGPQSSDLGSCSFSWPPQPGIIDCVDLDPEGCPPL